MTRLWRAELKRLAYHQARALEGLRRFRMSAYRVAGKAALPAEDVRRLREAAQESILNFIQEAETVSRMISETADLRERENMRREARTVLETIQNSYRRPR